MSIIKKILRKLNWTLQTEYDLEEADFKAIGLHLNWDEYRIVAYIDLYWYHIEVAYFMK